MENTKKNPVDGGDILGMAPVKKHKTCESGDPDALVESQPSPCESIFGSLDVGAVPEGRLKGLVDLMSMRLCTASIAGIMQEAGAPALQPDDTITKMVSEACKIYMHELIELWVNGGTDFISGDSILMKKYRL